MSDRTKGYLADSLLILMARKPYDVITIGEITAKAGVDRSTYYRNFHTKSDIVKFYYSRLLREYADRPREDSLEGLFTHFLRYRGQLLLLDRRGLSPFLLESLGEVFGAARGGTFEERFLAQYHMGGIFGTLLFWFSDGMDASPGRLAQCVANVLSQKERETSWTI